MIARAYKDPHRNEIYFLYFCEKYSAYKWEIYTKRKIQLRSLVDLDEKRILGERNTLDLHTLYFIGIVNI